MTEQPNDTATEQDMPEKQTPQKVREWLDTVLNPAARAFAGDRRMRRLTIAFLDMWKDRDSANYQLEGQRQMRHAVTAQLQEEQRRTKALAALVSVIVLTSRFPVSEASRDDEEQSIRLAGNPPFTYTIYFGEVMELVTTRPGMLEGHFKFDEDGQLVRPDDFRRWMNDAALLPHTSRPTNPH